MASHVWKVRAKIMHSVIIWILAAEHVFQEWFQEVCEPPRVSVEEEWESWENNLEAITSVMCCVDQSSKVTCINCLTVAIAADLFEKQDRVVRCATGRG